MSDEDKLALFVQKDAERNLLDSKELHGLAFLVPNVVVIKVVQSLFFNICS